MIPFSSGAAAYEGSGVPGFRGSGVPGVDRDAWPGASVAGVSPVDRQSDPALAAWVDVFNILNEAQQRLAAGQKAMELGWGGITRVQELTGLDRNTINRGIRDLKESDGELTLDRIRRSGGGRKRVEQKDPEIVGDLHRLLDENTVGDPMSLLKWTCKSTSNLATEMSGLGHPMGADTVGRLLHDLGYSLQSNQKSNEGGSHPDRDGQFRYINETVKSFVQEGQPVISVDAKKKELVGEFKNPGRTWRESKKPRKVNVYDFPTMAAGKAVPYGIYDTQRNEGMVNVGVSHDTGEFAVESIRQWWQRFGSSHYPKAKKLLICADNGGSNGGRTRSWKIHLQQLADQTGLSVHVCHYPPGTSKWNKIEHRMFSHISLNWKGQPLISFETVVNLISGTRTRKGLKVNARLDDNEYEKGVKFSDEEMENLKLTRHEPYPSWNYTIDSRQPSRPPRKRTSKRAA